MVEDIYLDRQGGTPSNTHLLGITHLQNIKGKHSLQDTWRKKKRTKIAFTYHNYNQTIHSRIDRIYATKNLKIQNTTIQPNPLSDHEIVSLTLEITKQKPKGRGIWKLNTSILKQKYFKEIFQKFWKNWQEQKIKYKSINQWWESGKIYFRMLAIEYCKEENYKTLQKQKNLTNQILIEKIKPAPNLGQLEIWQQQLEDIENYRIQGTIIRSKEKQIINQEKPNKYFHQQEKQKQFKKQINQLITDPTKLSKQISKY